jgi:hypothetical protein
MKRLHSPICYPKLEYLQASFLMDTETIIDLYGNTVFGITGPWNRPATQHTFMRLIKCFDDLRTVRLWLMIPEMFMNKNLEKILPDNASKHNFKINEKRRVLLFTNNRP